MSDLIYGDTCAFAHPITVPIFTVVIQKCTVICLRSVAREIVRLYAALDPEDRQCGQRAALTLVTLQTLPRVTVVLDCNESGTSYGDDDLVGCAKATNGMIYTADTGLQQRAETEGIAVLRVQDMHRRFRTMMPTLQEIFPPLRDIAIGETVTVRVHKLGRFAGEGTGVLDDGRQVVIRGGANYVGTEVTARVTKVQHTIIGEVVFAADPRPTPDVAQADALRAADSTVIPLREHARR